LGYWKEEGLEVNLIAVAGSSIAMQMLMTGQVDYASSGLPTYLATRAQTDRVSAYYCVYSRNQFQIAVLADSPIKSIKDMAGKKFGVIDLASASVVYTKAVLQAEGIDPKTVPLLPLSGSPAAVANGLSNGVVDGIAVYDSIVGGARAILSKEIRVIRTPYDDTFRCGLVVAARRDSLKSDPAVAAGIARGIAKATAFALANPSAVIGLHWKAYPETRPGTNNGDPMKASMSELNARLETMLVDRGKGEKWGDIDEKNFETYEKFLLESGEIKKLVPFGEAFDRGLIGKINDWNEMKINEQARNFGSAE
jgi:NitT/TauT family transport system substrate-binding protein